MFQATALAATFDSTPDDDLKAAIHRWFRLVVRAPIVLAMQKSWDDGPGSRPSLVSPLQ